MNDWLVKTGAGADFDALINKGDVDNATLCIWARNSVLYRSMSQHGYLTWCCVRYKNKYVDMNMATSKTGYGGEAVFIFNVLTALGLGQLLPIAAPVQPVEVASKSVITKAVEYVSPAKNNELPQPPKTINELGERSASLLVRKTEEKILDQPNDFVVTDELNTFRGEKTPYSRLLEQRAAIQNVRPFNALDPFSVSDKVLALPLADFLKKIELLSSAIK